MGKKVIVILSCLLLMCSCFSGCAKYDNQEKIRTNYNNITNRCRFWLTTDSICYLNNSLFQRYILVNKNNERTIGFSAGYGLGEVQRYGDKIYILDQVASKDERNSKFSLKRYDVKSKSTKKICSINIFVPIVINIKPPIKSIFRFILRLK